MTLYTILIIEVRKLYSHSVVFFVLLNMQNILYFCVLLPNYSRKQSENCYVIELQYF